MGDSHCMFRGVDSLDRALGFGHWSLLGLLRHLHALHGHRVHFHTRHVFCLSRKRQCDNGACNGDQGQFHTTFP